MSYFGVNAHLYSVNFGLFEEKTVISPLLKVLESLGRWQMNRQTYTLKVKIFQNFHKGKIEQGNIKTGRVAHCATVPPIRVKATLMQ